MNIDGKSLDVTQDNLAKLKQLFPGLIKEGQLDLNALKATFGQEPTLAEERYGLSWAGKYESFKQVQEQTTHTLIPDRESSVEFDQSENIFIEGENLDVLKILQKSYYGQVKLIYIDPPYNTGNDHFIYPDKYAERKEDYLQRTGATDDQGYLNKADLFRKNSRENGHFHSVWLSMMYPRLYLARNLLREDGVIFVSIDDNEVANLRLLMDEVFGEENFVASILWQKRTSPDARLILGAAHDYILVYSKSVEFLKDALQLLPIDDNRLRDYNNPDNDPRGDWASRDITGQSGHATPSQYYEIITPDGTKYLPPEGRCWAISEGTFQKLVSDNRIWFGKSGNARPRLKLFLSENKGKSSWSWWTNKDVGHNQEATKEFNEIIGTNDLFNNPKPIRLIKRILQLSTNSLTSEICLDFFAGSCTTAHAVLDLNNEDNGNRKFICIQLPEEAAADSEARKAGYNTIAAIGRARIRKVIERMKAEQARQLPGLSSRPAPGFRAFTLASSNFKIWRGEVKLEDELLTQLELFQQPAHSDNEEAMLWELLLKAGYLLSSKIETRQVGGAALHFINEGEIIIALQAVNLAVIETVRQVKPSAFICLDQLFNDDDQLKANTSLQFQDDGIAFRAI